MSDNITPTATPAPKPSAGGQRFLFIDALKALGSQFIVLHHLAFYGPMSDWTHSLAPGLVEWFSRDARMAVQVFLVVAGFLAARTLAPDGVLRTTTPGRALWQRYVRIGLPYLAALVVAMLCTELARLWMEHDTVSEPPTAWQFLAHALMIQSLIGVDSLSAGVWYVAIDLQLFALLLLLLWAVRSAVPGRLGWQPRAARLAVTLVVLASFFHFNRDAQWDNWALYFFGAYGLGVLTAWASAPEQADTARWLWWGVVMAAMLALAVDYRERLVLALMVAGLLAWSLRGGWFYHWPQSRILAYLGRISYSVFLLNFPVALVVNAWFTRFASPDPVVQTLGVVLAWLACNVAGALFHHAVEQPLSRLGRSRREARGRSRTLLGLRP